MNTNLDSAKQFFEACETGKGWEGCNAFCHPEATFSSQRAVLADISTLEGYCEWMKNLFIPVRFYYIPAGLSGNWGKTT